MIADFEDFECEDDEIYSSYTSALEHRHGRKYELDYLVFSVAESVLDVGRVEKLPVRQVVLHLQLSKFSRWVSEESAKVLSKK